MNRDVIAEIAAERKRQIEVEGWTTDHDDTHDNGEMAHAAACYALGVSKIEGRVIWPWSFVWWKPKDRRSDLIRAAALLVADIERLDRTDPTEASDEQA